MQGGRAGWLTSTDGEPSEGTASFPWSSVWFCNLSVCLHVPKCSVNVTPNRIHIAWNIQPRARSLSYVLVLESQRKRMMLFGWQHPKWAPQAHHNKQTLPIEDWLLSLKLQACSGFILNCLLLPDDSLCETSSNPCCSMNHNSLCTLSSEACFFNSTHPCFYSLLEVFIPLGWRWRFEPPNPQQTL